MYSLQMYTDSCTNVRTQTKRTKNKVTYRQATNKHIKVNRSNCRTKHIELDNHSMHTTTCLSVSCARLRVYLSHVHVYVSQVCPLMFATVYLFYFIYIFNTQLHPRLLVLLDTINLTLTTFSIHWLV